MAASPASLADVIAALSRRDDPVSRAAASHLEEYRAGLLKAGRHSRFAPHRGGHLRRLHIVGGALGRSLLRIGSGRPC